MKALCPVLLALVACDSSPGVPDASPTADATDLDGQAIVDATADATPEYDAPIDATAVECYSSNGYHMFGVGGGGTLVVELTLDLGADATDGIYGAPMNGAVPLQMDDVAKVAITGKVASSGGGIWHLATPDVLGGPMVATHLGDAPGVAALAYASNANLGLYGAVGLTIEKINLSPFGLEALGTLTAPGCTGIADFGVADSGDTPYFQFLLDCAGGDRYMTATYDAINGILVVEGPDAAGPTDLAGLDNLNFATSGDTLYRIQAGGTFTVIRNLSPCIGAVRGID